MHKLGCILILSFTALYGHAQLIFDLGSSKQMVLNFESTNHFIVLDVMFGNVLPLKFIFDTGSEHTLLFKKEYADLLGIHYDRRIPLMGSDLSQEIYGYIARAVSMKLSNVYTVQTDILVLEEDYLRLEESTGIKVDGIIGSNLFRYFVLSINNKKNKITFTKTDEFRPPRSFQELPIDIYRNKPYIQGEAILGKDSVELTLLLDTGAGLPVLLYTSTLDHWQLPEKTIPGRLGSGLGGNLEGYIGRLDAFRFGEYEFNNILSSFQEIPVDSISGKAVTGRNGLIGNSVLSRFNMIIDYPREHLYMKSRGQLKKKFKYDKSGLQLAAAGHNLKDFIIQRVLEDSPAHLAGLKMGDVIKKIEGIPTSFYTLTGINNILSGRTGRKVSLFLNRDGERVRAKIKLDKII